MDAATKLPPSTERADDWIPIPKGALRGVPVAAFEMQRGEVTVAAWQRCVEAGACRAPLLSGAGCNWSERESRSDHPINCVSPREIERFLQWARELWPGARLPTRAEWEYAARSGDSNFNYPWGDEDPTCGRAVIDNRKGEKGELPNNGCGLESTGPVCSKRRRDHSHQEHGDSMHGVCDLTGNVWEWVQDPGEEMRTRGGSWVNSVGSGYLKVTTEGGSKQQPTNYIGFRLVR